MSDNMSHCALNCMLWIVPGMPWYYEEIFFLKKNFNSFFVSTERIGYPYGINTF